MAWETKAFLFNISFDVNNIVLADIRTKLKGQAGFQRQNWEQAANFALNSGDLNEALVWIDAAIVGQLFYTKSEAMNREISKVWNWA